MNIDSDKVKALLVGRRIDKDAERLCQICGVTWKKGRFLKDTDNGLKQ
ncbi:MAG: hypothetical protein QXI71_04850 [Candidatus Bathyarchaeia archaeon]